MIRVSGQFYFKFYGDDFNYFREIFRNTMARLSSVNLNIKYTNMYISNDSWSDMCDETYQAAVDINMHIDESFYCLEYDEHDIKKFVKRLMQYNIYDENITYLYVENMHIEAIYDGKKRNSMYDGLCRSDIEAKPINVKKPVQQNKHGNEQIGSKRRIFILGSDNE